MTPPGIAAERRTSPTLLRHLLLDLVRLVASDDSLGTKADQDVVWVFQRLSEATTPRLDGLTEVPPKKPGRPIGIKRLDRSTPAHANVVDETAFRIEVDDAQRAAWLALDALRKGVVAE